MAARLPVEPLPGPSELRQQLTAALDKFVSRGRRAEIPEADLAEARYALVALLDEQVLKASWAGRAEWMNRPLQFELYRDNNAGEDFFVRLSALLRDGGRPLAVQVYYACLALGFQGMYAQNGDLAALSKFTSVARKQLGAVLPPPDVLSPHVTPRPAGRAEPRRHTPLLPVAAVLTLATVVMIAVAAWAVNAELESALAEITGARSSRAAVTP